MMIFDRQKQSLLLDGRKYTSKDISSLIERGEKEFPRAIWELLLFLNEWFDDSPTLVVHTSGSTGVKTK